MVLVFCRHGDDENDSSDDPTHIHDHHINDKGKKKAYKFMKNFIKTHGHPAIIYVSPFQRGLETIEAMKPALDLNKVEIRVDPRFSRFFNSKEKKKFEVCKGTLKYKPPIMESREAFHKRTKRIFASLKKKGYVKSSQIVMCITHALVLKDIAKYTDVKLPEHYDFLEMFGLHRKDGKIYRCF